MKYVTPVNGDTSDPNRGWPNADPSNGLEGAIPDGAGIEHPLRELVALITLAGLIPSELDLQQAAKAIRSGRLNYVAAAGTANALTLTLTPAPTSLSQIATTPLRVLVATTNTGAVTINVNSLGALPLQMLGGAAMVAGQLPAGGIAEVALLPGLTAFQVLSLTPAAFPKGGRAHLTSTTSWTVPAGVYKVEVEALGAGGGGGGSSVTGAAATGGNGGAMGRGIYAVTPGQVITVTVGVGGSGAAAGANNGAAGGSSSFGSMLTAGGGLGGVASGGGVQTAVGANATVTGANVSSNIGSQSQPGFVLSGNTIMCAPGGPSTIGPAGDRHAVDSAIGKIGNHATAPGQGGNGAVGNAGGGNGASGYVDIYY